MDGKLDRRFSDPAAEATPWRALRALELAELYWLATVRADGRPHVTPLIGVVAGGAAHFCTGLDEQKARNLEQGSRGPSTARHRGLPRSWWGGQVTRLPGPTFRGGTEYRTPPGGF